LQFEVAALGLVRLGYDGGDLEWQLLREFLETGAGQFRRAHENDF
jgi:hypothetical protein